MRNDIIVTWEEGDGVWCTGNLIQIERFMGILRGIVIRKGGSIVSLRLSDLIVTNIKKDYEDESNMESCKTDCH